MGDNGHYIPLDDNQALEDALAASSKVLQLRLRPPRPPSTMDHTVDNTVVIENDDPPPPPPFKPRANTTIILRIYHHLHRHTPSAAADALDQLSDTLDANPRDVTALRDNRHRVTHLFASFLHHLHTRPQDYRITKGLHRQLVQRFDEIASDIDLSPDTTEAIHNAIRAVSHCRSSVTLIRNKYTELMPEDVPPPPISKTSDAPLTRASQEEDASNSQSRSKNCSRHSRFRLPRRPLKYYFIRLDRMIAASSDNVKAFYVRLVRYQTHLEKKGFEFPDWSVPLCRSIERTIFRVSRAHLVEADKSDELQIDSLAVQEFGASVTRKLKRAGFPEKYAIRSGELAELMASDDGIVTAVASWSKKKLKRLTANAPVRMRYREGNGVRGKVGNGSGGSTTTGEGRTGKGGGGNSSNGRKGGGDSLGSGKGSTRLSKDFSAGSGDVWRVSRITDASGGSRRSWSHQDAAVRSGSPSRSNSRSRSHSLRSGEMGVGSAGAGAGSTGGGGGGSSSGHARRSHVGSHGSPKSLADDEFAFRMELDSNPFGSPNFSNANVSSERQRPLSRDLPPVMTNGGDVNGGWRGSRRSEKVPLRSNGGGAGESPGGSNAIHANNASNKPVEKDLRKNALDDDEDDEDDEDEDDIVNIKFDERLRRTFHRNFGDDIEFDDDEEDFDDELVGGGGGSDDTRQSQWARVNMEKTKHRPEGQGYTDDKVDDDVIYDVQSIHQQCRQRQAMPTQPQPQAQRRGGYRVLSPSTSGPTRRERQTSPRPPHHDGYSVDIGAGAAAGSRSGNGSSRYGHGGHAVGLMGSEVGGVSTHASETGTIGLATETGTATGRTMSMQRKLGLNGLDDTFEDDIDYQFDDLDDEFDDTIIQNATYVLRNAAVSKANSIKYNGDDDGIHDDDADSFDTNETIHSDQHGGVGFGIAPLSNKPQQRQSGVPQVPAVAHGEYEPAGGLGLGFQHHHHQGQGQQQERQRGGRRSTPSMQTLGTSQWEPPNSESQWNGWTSYAYSDLGRNGPGVGDSITDASVGEKVASGVSGVDAPLASSGGRPPVANGNMSTSSNVRNLRPVRS